MKTYELGEEVYIVCVVNRENFGNDPAIKKGKIINRVEVEDDPEKYQYQIEGHDGTVPAKKVFEDIKIAKQHILAHAKNKDKAKELIKNMEIK